VLTIIRGLPGSGKSTLAKFLCNKKECHYEADMYHTDKNGIYKFEPLNIVASHKWCREQVEKALKNKLDVIVSNTFTTIHEMEPYIDLWIKYDTKLRVICCVGQFKSIHNVPDEVFKKFKNRWEPYPGEYMLKPIRVKK